MTQPADNYVTSLSDAGPSPVAPDFGPHEAPVATPAFTLGGRADPTSPSFDIDYLRRVTQNPNLLPRSQSPGVSGALNEFLSQTGYAYTVSRAQFNDAGPHQAGNALDVTGDDVHALVQFLRAVPWLFSAVVYIDPDYSEESLFISGGAIVTSSTFSETDYGLHLASTRGRFAQIDSSVIDAFGQVDDQVNRDVFAVQTPDIGGQVAGQEGALR